MKIRSVLCCASVLVTVAALSACAGSDGETSGTAGSSAAGANAAGAPASVAGSGPSLAGAPSSAGGSPATSGGAPSTAGAPSLGGAPSSAGAGSAGAPGGAGAAGSPAGGGGAPSTQIPDNKVSMYLPNWNGSFASWSTKLNLSKMTHLNLAFGTIKGNSNDWGLAADADVKALTAVAHAANVKVLISIGGASDDIGIINRYKTEANIAPMVANLDALVTRCNLDGVDVDIERGNEMKSSGNFGKFVDALNATFKPKGRLVTAALAQYIMEDAGNDAGVNTWMKSFDFINLMIYNKNMSAYTKEIAFWTGRGLDKRKMVWGVIFDGSSSADLVKQVTIDSKAYGGVMAWELSESQGPQLWKVVQDNL